MNVEKIKSGFQLLATSILKLDFKNNFVIMNDSIKVERTLDTSYDINDITHDEEENLLMGTITLNVLALIKSEEAEMNINMNLQGCFISEKTDDIEAFKKMLGINGCATLYSIARSIILSITSQACAGAHVLLPMINIFELNESSEKEQE